MVIATVTAFLGKDIFGLTKVKEKWQWASVANP